jgi:hypothetical protein
MNSIKLNKVRELGGNATWLWIIFAIITGIYITYVDNISTPLIKLFIVIPGAYHSWTIVKESKQVFEKIDFDEQTFKFYFQFAFKDPIIYNKSEVSVEVFEDKAVFKDIKSTKIIGTLYKNQFQNEEDWNLLRLSM